MNNKIFVIILLKLTSVIIFSIFLASTVWADEGKFSLRLVEAAKERTTHEVTYDGAYLSIKYPMGDVPSNIGVCTDLVIRSYRKLGIDLQKLVHEDMKANFSIYPKNWGLSRTDTNIDHRRVPNLQKFFKRKGESLPKSRKGQDYRAGDLVIWMLPGNLPHIGIVSDNKVSGKNRPMILHNIGQGPKEDDILFEYPITGHYRYVREIPIKP